MRRLAHHKIRQPTTASDNKRTSTNNENNNNNNAAKTQATAAGKQPATWLANSAPPTVLRGCGAKREILKL